MKNCVPKYIDKKLIIHGPESSNFRNRAPTWYVHLQEDIDYQGCNGGHCYCDDKDGCNEAASLSNNMVLICVAVIFVLVQNGYSLQISQNALIKS